MWGPKNGKVAICMRKNRSERKSEGNWQDVVIG